MDELDEFISVLNAECDVLKKKGLMPKSEDEPWRYYSPPLDDEYEFEHLRAVLEAGKYTLEAEKCCDNGNDIGLYQYLVKAQQKLLNFLSTQGKSNIKKLGNSKGGSSKNDTVHNEIISIAEELLLSGHEMRGLAAKIAKIYSNKTGIDKDENRIRDILKKYEFELSQLSM